MDAKTCPICQKSFRPRSANQINCSRACWAQWTVGRERPSTQRRTMRTCETCGGTFETGGRSGKHPTARFCSTACAGAARKITRTCKGCGKNYFRKNDRGGFCSRECYFNSIRGSGEKILDLTCLRCGKQFQRYPSLVRNPERVYCSGECRAEGRVYTRGAENPLWKGGTYINSHGYRYVIDHTRPPKHNGSYHYVAEHINVVEEHLGRKLTNGEQVHHLNGDTLDNRWENLVVMTNTVHRALHGFYSQQFQLEHAAKGDLEALTRTFIDSQSESTSLVEPLPHD